MKKLVAMNHTPGRLTVLAALLAGFSAPALAVSPNLVISQVYGAGGNSGTTFFTHDYIEIFNRGATAVTASGWTVQYGSAGSTGDWSGKSVLPTFTIEPGQYMLIQQQSGGGTTQAGLPTPFVVPSPSFNMSGTTGKVALVNNNVILNGANPASSNIVDMVGFGTANGGEGARAPAPSNTTALFRGAGGCTDTDENSTDFTTASPAPRTSASPLNVCGGTPAAAPIVTACPSGLSLEQGVAGFLALGASDADSIVNGASIISGATTGITLGALTPAPAAGGSASVNLQAGATLAPGAYPLAIRFVNNDGQSATCNVTVSVGGLVRIPAIQGAGATSPLANSVVQTEGVVTHTIVGGGYFIQDVDGDGDPATSDALYVFTTNPAIKAGDRVRVTGTVTEYKPSGATTTYTELKDITATTVISSGNSVTPTNIMFDPAQDLERYEGMLISIGNELTVSQTNYLGDRGELTLSLGRRETVTNRYRPGTPEAIALAAYNIKNQLILDDSLFSTPTEIPYLGADGTVRAGDTVSGLTGVLDFGSIGGGGADFKLHPTKANAPVFSRSNPRQAAPVVAAGNVRVASANVLNFFTTFTNGGDASGATGQGCTIGTKAPSASECRGADNMVEFVRQRDKIVSELKALDADAIGLMEIQNNGDIAVDYLVKQLNAAVGFETYAYVPKPATTGTDAIRVAMIYKPAKLTLVGGALSDGDTVNNRPPMAQTFRAANGAKFSLIVNHLKSKGSCPGGSTNPDRNTGDGQSCWNQTRVQQAQRLVNYFIPQVVNTAGDPDVLVIGDMNAYGFEDPINVLTQSGFVNQLERFVRPNAMPYSYVFDGESGYLDHALASASLNAQVAGATEWHTNADEPTVIDYNTIVDGTAKSPAGIALYTSDAFRSSDHDPVVVALNLAPTFNDVTAGVSVQRSGFVANRLTGKYSGTVTLTNTSGAALNGPIHLQFDGLAANLVLDNKTGTRNGAPYITLANTTIAAGASVTVPVVFSNPSKLNISFGNTIISGTF